MNPPNFRLDGGVVLVTGAASGIGAGVARGLARCGAALGCADRSADGIAAVVADIERAGGRALGLPLDVREESSLAASIDALEAAFGPLTGALNCAGVHDNAPAVEMGLPQWQRLIDINLTGVFLSARAEARAMIKNGGGSIVNVGSISAHIANRGLAQAHYNAAKAGVAHLSRSLALEWASQGVRVNVISPGYTATPMALSPGVWEHVRKYIDDIPMARMCEVDELVGPAVFLLSEASSYCTGLDLVVDGGATCW